MLLCSSVSVSLCSRLSFSSKFLSGFRHSYSLLSDSSSCSDRFRLIWLTPQCSKKFRTFGTASAVAVDGNADTFFASESVSWTSLGLSGKISRALADSGIERPSLIQAACIPSIISGKDVVVAAETGSGKTHSYLAPLINQLSSTQVDSKSTDSDEGVNPTHRFALVLCPNVLLCQQVVQMANGLCDESGKPLLRVAAVCGRQGWPVNEPHIIVSTPAALLNYIEPNKNHRLLFLRAVKYVVFDEADMLLGGGFLNKVIRLMHMLRFDEKLLSRSKKDPEKPLKSEPDSLSHVTSDDENELQNEILLEVEEIYNEVVDVSENLPEAEKAEAGSVGRKEWWRARKIYERSKQYIFVAATLPVNGKKTAGALLKKLFPDATWISGNYLHCHSPRLEQRWIEVTIDTQVDELLKAVNHGSKNKRLDCGDGVSRTMIFGNTVDAVEAIANILVKSGTECFRYHKDCTLEDRAKTLSEFREKGGILVCTDAASRGVDIPNVAHIIQAEFSTSAVDFLHRVGRTGRASHFGLVTNLYTESNRDLVAAVRQAGDLSQPVETAFSRKRSFRNKLKKRGLVKESAPA